MNSVTASIIWGMFVSCAWAVLLVATLEGLRFSLARWFPLSSGITLWMGTLGFIAISLKAFPFLFVPWIVLTLSCTLLGLPTAVRSLRSHWRETCVFLGGTLLWSVWLRDLDGLPSFNDGIVHTLFTQRIWELKRFPLFDQPLPFSEFFQLGHFQFYPQLTHFFAIAVGAPLRAVSWAIPALTPAQFMKGNLIALCAGYLTLAFAMARETVLDQPRNTQTPSKLVSWAIILIATLFASTYFRYPFSAVDQGAWSRIAAMFCVVLWGLGPKPIHKDRAIWRLASFAPVALTAYLMHPQAAALAFLFWTAEQRFHWRSALSLLFALALLFAALKFFVPSDYTLPLSELKGATASNWAAIPRAIWTFFSGALTGENYSHLLLRKVALVLGAGVLILTSSAPLWRKRVLLWTAAGAILTASGLIAAPLARIAGAPFYHEAGRIAELYWPLLPAVWTYGLLLLWTWIQMVSKSRSVIAFFIVFVTTIFITSELAWKWPRSLIQLQGHLDFYNEKYLSPRISKTGHLIRELDALAAHEAKPILLIAPPFFADSFEFRMRTKGSRSYFVYGECPIGGIDPLVDPACRDRNHAWTAGKIPQELLNQYSVLYWKGDRWQSSVHQ